MGSSICERGWGAIRRPSAASRRTRPARSSRTSSFWARPRAKRTSRPRAICAPTTSSRASSCGSFTWCRSRANLATTPGRKMRGNTSAAPTSGARSPSTPSAPLPTSRPDRQRSTSMAPIATGRTSSAIACSPWMHGPASACGTSRTCTTISGTTTIPRPRS